MYALDLDEIENFFFLKKQLERTRRGNHFCGDKRAKL